MSTLATPKHKMRGSIIISILCLLAVVLMTVSLVAEGFYIVHTETAFYTETTLEFGPPEVTSILWYLANSLPILMLMVYCLFLHKFPKASFFVTAIFLVLFLINTYSFISLILSQVRMYLDGVPIGASMSFYTHMFMRNLGFGRFYYNAGFSLIITILSLLFYGTIGISLLVASFGTLNGFTKKWLVVIPMIVAVLTVFVQNLLPWLLSVMDAINILTYWNGPISYMAYMPYAPLWCLYGNETMGYMAFLLALVCFVSMNMIFPIRKKPVTKISGSAEKKLKMLNKQLKHGIITEEDFEAQRTEIIGTL